MKLSSVALLYSGSSCTISVQKCPKLYWKHKVGDHVISFDDTPFSLGEKRTLHCQYGIQYYKSKSHTSDRVLLQGTRKKGFTALIEIMEYNIYPPVLCEVYDIPRSIPKENPITS